MRWHPYSLQCPTCKTEATICRLLFRADCAIKVQAVCEKCEYLLEKEVDVEEIALACAQWDGYTVTTQRGKC